MKKSELSNLSDEDLETRLNQRKTFMGVFVVIILALLFFFIRDLLSGRDVDIPVTIIIICSIGGLLSIYLEYKGAKEELSKRK